ncbi:unnamed protein product [Strongylus vulgaris]|uniref:Uncharacterized protein n=1 Tax=Strongylus vulgaris TaxID=40348 RepID=A0A3P7JN49_STRVU|nr:unnamed protein product [Strongylus vulgaris]
MRFQSNNFVQDLVVRSRGKGMCQLGLALPVVLQVIRKHRLYWTSASDVRNTQRSLAMQPGRLHEDDLQSLILRHQLAVEEDAIRKFELPTTNDGAGFRLIVITPEQAELIKRYSAAGISIDDKHCTTTI